MDPFPNFKINVNYNYKISLSNYFISYFARLKFKNDIEPLIIILLLII